ncbi:hypothetical protein KCP71_24495 [Salmonella enterica subsp. enterica]|nr:hypothetical protein KCP71_24495 [Salmonella enterica subsp. enterica]
MTTGDEAPEWRWSLLAPAGRSILGRKYARAWPALASLTHQRLLPGAVYPVD